MSGDQMLRWPFRYLDTGGSTKYDGRLLAAIFRDSATGRGGWMLTEWVQPGSELPLRVPHRTASPG